MNQGLISKRYAKALLEYATEREEDGAVYECMKQLNENLSHSGKIVKAFESPMLDIQSKLTLIQEAGGGDVPSSYMSFFRLIIKNNREEFIRWMALNYIDLYRKSHNIIRASIISAEEVADDMIEKMRTFITQMTEGTVEIGESIEPEIEGGFILQIDDMRLDASVKGQIEKIRSQFARINKTIV